MKKSYLMRRPNSDDEQDYNSRETVFAKPMKTCFSKKLNSCFQSKDFVKGTEKSQREFYKTQTIIQNNSKNFNISSSENNNLQNLNIDTYNERNKINAKIIKAELKQDKELLRRLKEKLEKLEKNVSCDNELNYGQNNIKTTILLKMDKKNGLIMPADLKTKSKSTELNVDETVEKKFYQNFDLTEIIKNEKKTTAQEQITMFNRAAKACSSYKTDDDWVLDDNIMSYSKKKRHICEDDQNEMKKRIKEHTFLERTLDSCNFCINNQYLAKNSIVSMGFKTYLAVVPWDGLNDQHCYIAPMTHYASTVLLDEDVYDEIKLWYKSLVSMWKDDKNKTDEEKDCVFFENAKNVNQQTHMYIECVPLPKKIGDLAPIYFKKALLECGKQWSDNQNLIELAKVENNKNIQKLIPKGFPYFFINFGLQPGYAYVIENNKSFSLQFAHEILAGMLDLPHHKWRNVRQMSFNEIKQKRDNFKKKWEKYDWTNKIKKN